MKTTSECEKCKYCKIDDTNKAKLIILCQLKNKKYIYGQVIPCDEK